MTVALRLCIKKVWDKRHNHANSEKYQPLEPAGRQVSLSESRLQQLERGIRYLEE